MIDDVNDNDSNLCPNMVIVITIINFMLLLNNKILLVYIVCCLINMDYTVKLLKVAF